jgi:hypothetical protein
MPGGGDPVAQGLAAQPQPAPLPGCILRRVLLSIFSTHRSIILHFGDVHHGFQWVPMYRGTTAT